MTDWDDHQLLAEFARGNSEAAFAALAGRYVNLVFSTALRSVGNAHAAEEISQAVFIILAQKAGKLSPRVVLSGWLYQTARLTAANYLRGEIRRQQRESEAYMQSTLNEPSPDVWPQIAPLLDDALGKLGETDRNAIVLRFFENKSLAEVGRKLGASEDAAKMRVNRALEKLRKIFGKRGVTLSATVIAGAVSAGSVQAAPTDLAVTISTIATTKGAAAGSSTLALVKGTMKTMTWLKIKFAIGVGLALLIAGGAIATGSKLSKPPETTEEGIAFEAEGTITYSITPDSRGFYSQTKYFKVMRDGQLWKIRTTSVKEEGAGLMAPKGDAMDLYHEMSFDGTNIYRLSQQDEQKALTRQPGFKPDVFALGRVERGDHPPSMDSDQLFPVWLAYCSAPYFHTLKSDKAVPPRFATRDFLTEASTNMEAPAKWNERGKFFMKDIEWFSDGTFEAFWGNGKQTVEKYQSPFDKGFVDGRFEVLTWTNWNGISVPASFTLTGYRPDFESTNGPRLVVYYTISATLEQIHAARGFIPIPELTTKTLISDARMKTTMGNPPGHLNSYVSTNRWDISDAIHNPAKLRKDGQSK